MEMSTKNQETNKKNKDNNYILRITTHKVSKK